MTVTGHVRPNGLEVPLVAVLAVGTLVGQDGPVVDDVAAREQLAPVAVIVNALRTSRSPRAEASRESPHTTSGLSRQTRLPQEVTIRV